jgi:hypothetical protein
MVRILSGVIALVFGNMTLIPIFAFQYVKWHKPYDIFSSSYQLQWGIQGVVVYNMRSIQNLESSEMSIDAAHD